MDTEYSKTIEFLAKTGNQAAVEALIPGLDSRFPEVQQAALQALLDRRDPLGQQAILERLDFNNPVWNELLEHKHGRLSQALRDAVLGDSLDDCERACQAIVRYREYDLVPVLITAAEAVDTESSEIAAPTILELSKSLYDDLTRQRDYSDRRDPQFVRRIAVGHLEQSAERYPQHRSAEIMESYLILAKRDNALLQTVLYNAQHPCYLPFLEILANAKHVGVIRLLLEFLDSNQTPAAILSTIAQRADRGFVRRLIGRWRDHATPAMRNSIRRLDNIPWGRVEAGIFDRLEEADQVAVLDLLLASGMPREELFAVVSFFLTQGTKASRHAAMQALADFSGPEADALVTSCLQAKDPVTVIAAISQARARNLTACVPQIIALAESPDEDIRQAVFDNMPEFHFERYWAGFDLMDEKTRKANGALVKRVDPSYFKRLQEELCSTKRSRRIKAAALTEAMQLAPRVEEHLIEYLQDEDELVREAMAEAIGGCNSVIARKALEQAADDRSPNVRNAVLTSLARMGKKQPGTPAHAQA